VAECCPGIVYLISSMTSKYEDLDLGCADANSANATRERILDPRNFYSPSQWMTAMRTLYPRLPRCSLMQSRTPSADPSHFQNTANLAQTHQGASRLFAAAMACIVRCWSANRTSPPRLAKASTPDETRVDWWICNNKDACQVG
jgi:hypothetical protein